MLDMCLVCSSRQDQLPHVKQVFDTLIQTHQQNIDEYNSCYSGIECIRHEQPHIALEDEVEYVWFEIHPEDVEDSVMVFMVPRVQAQLHWAFLINYAQNTTQLSDQSSQEEAPDNEPTSHDQMFVVLVYTKCLIKYWSAYCIEDKSPSHIYTGDVFGPVVHQL